jgi:hypothetical protein
MSLSCEFSFTPSHVTSTDSGLGNILFQIASTFGIAYLSNRRVCFHSFEKIKNTLSPDYMDTIFRKIPTTLISKIPEKIINEDISNAQILSQQLLENTINSKEEFISVNGYLESFLYFDHIKETIQNLFSIDKTTLTKFKQQHPILFDNNIIKVAVHIRQYYGSISYSVLFFENAMKEFNESNTVFIIFSNDIEWCKNNFSKNKNIEFIHSSRDYEDLWAMSLCDHYIINHSTMGWWGAYLNKKNPIVYYPDQVFKINEGRLHHSFVNLRRKNEHYKPEWNIYENETNIFL